MICSFQQQGKDMKIKLRSDIKCPNCQTRPTIETGFWGFLLTSAFFESLLERFEKEGCIVTCPHCKIKYTVKGTNNP